MCAVKLISTRCTICHRFIHAAELFNFHDTYKDYEVFTFKVRTKDGKMRKPLKTYESKPGQYINNFFGCVSSLGKKGIRAMQSERVGEKFKYVYAHSGSSDEIDIVEGARVESVELCLEKLVYDTNVPFDETTYPFRIIKMTYFNPTELGEIRVTFKGHSYDCEKQDLYSY